MNKIRIAEERDTEAVLKIYKPFIENTPVSFETSVPTLSEFWNRIQTILTENPWLVCEIDGDIAGYAYAGNHRIRASYQWTKEVSVYIQPSFRRCGIAKGLYTTLIGILKFQGVHSTLAGITLPNANSVRFHQRMGFREIGTYTDVGFKFGTWHCVSWWEHLNHNQKYNQANALKPLENVMNTPEWDAMIKKGVHQIKYREKR
jgi:phosphinothricin acetyltransferase